MEERIAPGPQGLPQQRAGARRQCRGGVRSSTTRSAASFSLRCRCSSTAGCRGRADAGLFRLAGAARRRGGAAGVRARRRHLGVSRPQPRAHPFCRHVLGRLQPSERIASHLGLQKRTRYWGEECDRNRERELIEQKPGTKSAAPSPPASASTISMPACCCCPKSDFLEAPRSPLRADGQGDRARTIPEDTHVMRYASEDDFGLPETAFLVCRFWLIDVFVGPRPPRSRHAKCSMTR